MVTPGVAARFLVGSRGAIVHVWTSRWSLLVGGLFVLSGSLARHYDGDDLLRNWHVLLHGFGASLFNSFVLYGLVRMAAAGKGFPLRGYWGGYLSFLGAFWMTAPMAWLYGAPYEQFLSPVDAVAANLWTLALVSVWRVVLITRVLSVGLNTPFFSVIFLVMLFGDAVAIVALTTAPLPTVDFMGGLHRPPEVELVASVAFTAGFFAVVTAPAWLIAGLVGTRWLKLRPAAIGAPARGRAPIAAMALAGAAIATWGSAAVVMQPQARLRGEVERYVDQGLYDNAVAVLTSHARWEFSPVWDLPPATNAGGGAWERRLQGMREAIMRHRGTPPWVGEAYARKTREEVSWLNWGRGFEELSAAEIVERFQSRGISAIRSRAILQFLIYHDPTLSEGDRARLREVDGLLEKASGIGLG